MFLDIRVVATSLQQLCPRHPHTQDHSQALTKVFLSIILYPVYRIYGVKQMAILETEDFLSQIGKTMVGVARLLLHYAQGEKLPRMMDLARKLKTGNGTIQEALTLLTKRGAIAVEAHGARGSYLAQIDYPLLWRYAGNDWIIGSMPLP